MWISLAGLYAAGPGISVKCPAPWNAYGYVCQFISDPNWVVNWSVNG